MEGRLEAQRKEHREELEAAKANTEEQQARLAELRAAKAQLESANRV